MINNLEKWKTYIKEELLLKEVYKDGIWLQQQLAKGRITENDLLYIELQSKLLEEIYPNEWGFDIVVELNQTTTIIGILKRIKSKQFKFRFKPIIHFTNFRIVNTIGQSLPINDIYVRLETKIDFNTNIPYIISSMSGTRTTISYNEYTNDYIHSHLSSTDYKSNKIAFNNFCQGSGEINMLMSKLSQGFNDNLFRTLLFHLKGYLEWESLEGGPYVKIANLHVINKNEGLIKLNTKFINKQGNQIFKIRKFEGSPKLTWRLTNNKISLVDNDLLEDYCLLRKDRKVQEIELKFLDKDIVFKDKGEYYPTNATKEKVELPENNYIIFKGEKRYLKVEGLLDNSNAKIYIHPQIKKYVKDRLEYEANRNFIRSYTIKRLQDKNSNASFIYV